MATPIQWWRSMWRPGLKAWAFKTAPSRDLWDYDNPAQPTPAMVAWKWRGPAHAVLQPTKQGLLFTLNRDTGVPVIPVVEQPVPQGGAPGELLSPTQPFPTAPRPLAPSTIRPQDAFGILPWGNERCRRLIAAARHEGLYTPPSLQGTILYPFTGGGMNWGGLAFDPGRQVAYVNTSSAMHLVTLIPGCQGRRRPGRRAGRGDLPMAGVRRSACAGLCCAQGLACRATPRPGASCTPST